jgi:hypothetical protein
VEGVRQRNFRRRPVPEKSVAQYDLHLYAASRRRAVDPILGGAVIYAVTMTVAEVLPMNRAFASKILFLLAGLVPGFVNAAFADVITFSGTITQPQDVTTPAANNPTLNNILINQAYAVTLMFAGSITAPGTYNLTGGSLTFSVPTAPASEASFGSLSLTITANGGFDDFSFLGCLPTGSGCLVGNQLDANFRILAAGLNAQNVAATGLDPPHPLDLLEDDGSTDIHGTITSYSYTGRVSAVPEPSFAGLLGSIFAGLAVVKHARQACRGWQQRQ